LTNIGPVAVSSTTASWEFSPAVTVCAMNRPGLRLNQVTDGLAQVIPVDMLHGHP
jgi:hypothetical protein